MVNTYLTALLKGLEIIYMMHTQKLHPQEVVAIITQSGFAYTQLYDVGSNLIDTPNILYKTAGLQAIGKGRSMLAGNLSRLYELMR